MKTWWPTWLAKLELPSSHPAWIADPGCFPVRSSSCCDFVFLWVRLTVSFSSCLDVFLWDHALLRLSSCSCSWSSSCEVVFLLGHIPVRLSSCEVIFMWDHLPVSSFPLGCDGFREKKCETWFPEIEQPRHKHVLKKIILEVRMGTLKKEF